MLIPLIAFFLNPAASASTARVSAPITTASAVTVSAQLENDIRGLWIHLEKPGAKPRHEDLFFPVKDRQFTQKIYLRYGSGPYELLIRETHESGKPVRMYYDVARLQVENRDPVTHLFLLPSPMVESDHPAIRRLAQQITNGLPNALAKSKAIHDWVATHIAYDAASFFRGRNVVLSALETLRSRNAYCNGYAHLNAALHRAAGIPSRIIVGFARTNGKRLLHAWNEIFVGGRWQHQDPTWDSGGISPGTHQFSFALSNRYFNAPASLFNREHRKTKVLWEE